MAKKSNGYWPEDLLTQILPRLPVKSIIRFKNVAKSWCSLFENPGFVSQHVSISKKKGSFLVRGYQDDTSDYKLVLIHLFLDQIPVSYQDLLPRNSNRCVICVYDGLLCFCDTIKSSITLCNPATREFRLLSECIENMPPNAGTFADFIGFGSDSFSNDYKVIYGSIYVDLETSREGRRHHAVYRMSTDSWRVLEGEDVEAFRHLEVDSNPNNACVNGVYYWVAFNLNRQYYKVLAFHFGNEVFELIDWPPIPDTQDLICGWLLSLAGDRISLCIPHSDVPERIHTTFDLTGRSFDIWVLNYEGLNWTKLWSIGSLLGVRDMLGFCNKKKNSNNKVFVRSVSGQLLLYDLDTQQFRDIGTRNKQDSDYFKVYSYEESLVSCYQL